MASKKEIKRVSDTLGSEYEALQDDLDDYFMGMELIADEASPGAQKSLMNMFNRADKAYEQMKKSIELFIKAQKKLNEGGTTIANPSFKSFAQIVKEEDIEEMTQARMDKEVEKAKKRIRDFWDRSKGDRAKFASQVNLRTKKMNKVEKVMIWADALEDENMHDEAEVAFKRLKELGVK